MNRARMITQKSTRRKEKVAIDRRSPETAPGHSQKIEGGDENTLERKLRSEKVVASKHLRLAMEMEEDSRPAVADPVGFDEVRSNPPFLVRWRPFTASLAVLFSHVYTWLNIPRYVFAIILSVSPDIH